MNYTDNYQLRKPVKGVNVADINDENANMDTIDAILHASQVSLAPAYDEHTTSENPYNTGAIVMYEFLMYKCLEDGVYGVWDPTKWERTTAGEEGGSGGGGNADYVELTQAEYDALTPQEKMNGKLYFIKDGQGEGGPSYFFPVIYSTEEREVGVWVDNKPLYCKTIDTGAIPSSGTKTVTHGIQNIDFLVTYSGIAYDDNGMDYRILPYVAFSNWSISLYADITNVYIGVSQNWGDDFPNSYTTLYYTKTTDTPGSGKYNTLGVPKVHYSTDEQVVGTDEDGNTIYEKTIPLSNLTNNAWNNIFIGSGCETIGAEGYLWFDNNTTWRAPISFYRGSDNFCCYTMGNSSGTSLEYIAIYTMFNGVSRTDGKIRVRYTKSSS